MIWLLVILLVPSGLNYIQATDILYKDFKPCDDTNITARMYRHQLSEEQKNQYHLLIPIPAETEHLILKFDTSATIKLIQPGRRIFLSRFQNTMNQFYIRFLKDPSDKLLNYTVLGHRLETIPYIRNIILDEHELCKNPKTGYLNDFTEKINASDVSSAMKLILANVNKKTDTRSQPDASIIHFPNEDNDAFYTVPNTTEERLALLNELFPAPNTIEEKTNAPDVLLSTIPNPPSFSILSNVSQKEELRPSQEPSCGRPKLMHIELIVHGQSTKYGHWPWHVAIYRIKVSSLEYICGGTLLSKTMVLTAAHCASIRGSAVVPEAFRIGLGKLHLFSADVGTQEREVFQVVIHPKFDEMTLDHDIALLKLKSEAFFTDYVRPACLWNEQFKIKLPYQSIFGTVVGWGFNQKDSLASTLQQATMPIQSELTCLRSNPTFFHQKLNIYKFCAGFGNVCNGDSGGGFMIFVTDTPGGTASGAWYVRGIVSIAPSRIDAPICNPYEYTIFTDVEKYRDWVLGYLN